MSNKEKIDSMIKKILLEELKHTKTIYGSVESKTHKKTNKLPSDEIRRVPEMVRGGVFEKTPESVSTAKEKILEIKKIIGKRGNIHLVPSVMRTEIVVDMQPNFLLNIIELWDGNYKVVYQPKMVDRKVFINLSWSLVKKLLKSAIKETSENLYKDTHERSIEKSRENAKSK